MENNLKKENGKSIVFIVETIIFMLTLTIYSYISKSEFMNDNIIADLVSEFSLSISILVMIRIVIAIFAVAVSAILSSLVISVFFSKFDNRNFDRKRLKKIIYESFFIGMTIHYLLLIISFVAGMIIDVNIMSIISYAVISIILGMLLYKTMKFKVRNIFIVIIVFYLLNSGAAILHYMGI